MLDNELFAAIIPVLKAGFIARGQPEMIVKQDYQPTNQGIPTKPAVYLHKIVDRRIGHVNRVDQWVEEQIPSLNPDTLQPFTNPDTGAVLTVPGEYFMQHVETQWYETDFQLSATATQDPKAPGLTASDIVNMAAGILQSSLAMDTLRGKKIGILRIRDIRNPYFVDEKNRFEANPSFDFTLTHETVTISTIAAAETVKFQIARV